MDIFCAEANIHKALIGALTRALISDQPEAAQAKDAHQGSDASDRAAYDRWVLYASPLPHFFYPDLNGFAACNS